jgi:hypothetical protein
VGELARALPDPVRALPLVLLSTLLLAIAPLRLTDDSWFDLVSGREIARHGLPYSDRVMSLTAGRSWSDQQWLAHLVSYGAYSLGGLSLFVLVDTACLVGAVALAMAAARSLGASPVWTTSITLPALALVVPSAVRAQSFAFPLFVLVVWLLARDARTPDRRIFLLIPLLAIWANVHGSVLLACGLVLVRAGIEAGVALRARAPRALLRPLALAAIALVAPFASPYGPRLFSYYTATATSGAFHAHISEWAGTTLRDWPIFFALAALVAVVLLRPETRLRLFDSICLAVLVLAGLDTVRNTIWLPFAAIVLVPPALEHWSPGSELRARVRVLLGALALVGAILTGVLAASLSDAKLQKTLPAAEGDAIARAAQAHPAWQVLTDEQYADWLLWRHPELRGRIAFDIRFELLGAHGLKQVVHMESAAGTTWNAPFARYRLALWTRKARPELVGALLAEPGARVLAQHKGTMAILRPPAAAQGDR